MKGKLIIKASSGSFKAGDVLTIDSDIIDINAKILHRKGDKVTIENLIVSEGFYSHLCPDMWIPEKINGVKLVGIYGHWNTSAFVEFQKKPLNKWSR